MLFVVRCTISDFRKIHLARLEALFVEVLKLCALAGLARVGTIALDGTKVKANASRHKAMSYDRMKAEEARLQKEIAATVSKSFTGRTLKALVEEPGVARGEADAPDIDGRVYVRGSLPLGEFARVRIVGHTDYDLIAEPQTGPAR